MKAKDKTTGTFKEVYVKALDSLPVGSEIDFEGTDIPTGWEETTDVNSYSTDEIKTNKTWIDGKPIYRKSFNGYFDDDDTILSNVSTLISYYGTTFIAGADRIIPYYEYYNNANYMGTLGMSYNNIKINLHAGGSVLTSVPCRFTVEYTKITD